MNRGTAWRSQDRLSASAASLFLAAPDFKVSMASGTAARMEEAFPAIYRMAAAFMTIQAVPAPCNPPLSVVPHKTPSNNARPAGFAPSALMPLLSGLNR